MTLLMCCYNACIAKVFMILFLKFFEYCCWIYFLVIFPGNDNLEAAANWIVEHENDPDIDQMPLVWVYCACIIDNLYCLMFNSGLTLIPHWPYFAIKIVWLVDCIISKAHVAKKVHSWLKGGPPFWKFC